MRPTDIITVEIYDQDDRDIRLAERAARIAARVLVRGEIVANAAATT